MQIQPIPEARFGSILFLEKHLLQVFLKHLHDLTCQGLNTNTQYPHINDIILQEIDKVDEAVVSQVLLTNVYLLTILYIAVHHLYIYATGRPRCHK